VFAIRQTLNRLSGRAELCSIEGPKVKFVALIAESLQRIILGINKEKSTATR